MFLFSAGLGSNISSITGSNYKSSSSTSQVVIVESGYFINQNWKIDANLESSFYGDYFKGGIGTLYHFVPFLYSVNIPSDSVQYAIRSEWSPYLGVEFSFARIQMTLQRTDNFQSDAVIGGLAGPTLKGGILYNIDSKLAITFGLDVSYMFSPQVAGSGQKLKILASFVFP